MFSNLFLFCSINNIVACCIYFVVIELCKKKIMQDLMMDHDGENSYITASEV